jgi:hypothetical protein
MLAINVADPGKKIITDPDPRYREYKVTGSGPATLLANVILNGMVNE